MSDETHDDTFRALHAMAQDPYAPDDRVSRDAATSQPKPRPANADLSTDDVHYSLGDATELLNDTHALLLSWRAELLAEADRPALTASVEEWLKRFEELGR